MVADTPKHGYIEFLERVAMITLTQVITKIKCATLISSFTVLIRSSLSEYSCKHCMSSSFSVDKPTTPCSLRRAAAIREKRL